MNDFSLEPLGPFSLREAARFWRGFTPAAHAGLDRDGHLHMAFPVEGGWTSVGVCLREVDGTLLGTVFGDVVDLEQVRQQTARTLSLDVDGRAFPEVGQRDAVVATLQQRYRGLRPVCFYSPYEAAAWAIISQRIQMRQAATIKARLAEALGDTVDVHGQRLRAFPSPQQVLAAEALPGLYARKADNLRAIAAAALAGALEAAHLRSLPVEEALASLQALPGIGPFSAQLILLRGAGHPDFLTFQEPRFRRAVGRAYALAGEPTDADLTRVSEAWRPYRTWVTFLLRQQAA